MATVKPESAALSTRTRVVAVKPLLGVAEGTGGRIETVSGLTWIRYWVRFDNGVWLGPVDTAAVVEEGDWPAYQDRRRAQEAALAEAAARAAAEPDTSEPEPSDAPAESGSGAEADGAASRIPAALLARSQAAKAKKAAATGG